MAKTNDAMVILGLMSGTSLDGVDLALCRVGDYDYTIIDATTVSYTPQWRERLATVEQGSALELAQTHTELGHLFGQMARTFLDGRPCDAIASHGHTIFHQPERGLTVQIGCADAICAETGVRVVSGFRTLDVALGGQGAPLVPIGDRRYFADYDACLNLGGIANISYESGQRIAYDICPCNMILNRLASALGHPFDPEGAIARQGHLLPAMLTELDRLDYYRQQPPKSLGKEWVLAEAWPIIERAEGSIPDKLRTACEHIALCIATSIQQARLRSVLITGGGAFNSFLISRIQFHTRAQLHVPDRLTVEYKEALIFALLGYLRLTDQPNTLPSATGAKCVSSAGSVSGLALL